MKAEHIIETTIMSGALIVALVMSCFPEADERIHNATTVESYRYELDTCFDKFAAMHDARGYMRCHCAVSEKYKRPCAFAALDGGAHD